MDYESVLSGFFVAMAAIVMVNYLVIYKLLKILKERYHDAWLSLDPPSLFVGNSITSFRMTFTYIKNGQYEELGDSELDRVAFALKIIFFVGMTVLAAGMVFTVAYLRSPEAR